MTEALSFLVVYDGHVLVEYGQFSISDPEFPVEADFATGFTCSGGPMGGAAFQTGIRSGLVRLTVVMATAPEPALLDTTPTDGWDEVETLAFKSVPLMRTDAPTVSQQPGDSSALDALPAGWLAARAYASGRAVARDMPLRNNQVSSEWYRLELQQRTRSTPLAPSESEEEALWRLHYGSDRQQPQAIDRVRLVQLQRDWPD